MRDKLTIFGGTPTREIETEERVAVKSSSLTQFTEGNMPLALLPPGFLAGQQRTTGESAALTRIGIGALWLLSLVLCGATVRYLDHQQATVDGQNQAIVALKLSIEDQHRQFVDLTNAMEKLATRPAAVPDKPQPPAPKPAVVPVAAAPAPLPAPAVAVPHNHEFANDIAPPQGAVLHYAKSGTVDYWLFPRMIGGVETMTKVQPIGMAKLGIAVHDLDDGQDYILTESGGWLGGEAAQLP